MTLASKDIEHRPTSRDVAMSDDPWATFDYAEWQQGVEREVDDIELLEGNIDEIDRDCFHAARGLPSFATGTSLQSHDSSLLSPVGSSLATSTPTFSMSTPTFSALGGDEVFDGRSSAKTLGWWLAVSARPSSERASMLRISDPKRSYEVVGK